MTTVIDVHTHMLSEEWISLISQHGAPRYSVKPSKDGPRAIMWDGAPFMTPQEGHLDYEKRIKAMNDARVDMAILTLTCPNVYWGGPEISLKAAQVMNDDMARAQTQWPDRIRFMASLPWQYPDKAVAELERACGKGAVGAVVLANVNGESLTDAKFAPIWQAIDRRGLPVLMHPTAPPGMPEMDMRVYNLIASVGFMFDTTLAVARMIFDGFFDTYPNLKLIASHAGGALPYLVGRFDICFENMNACRVKISRPPAEYLRHIYYDSVTYRQESLNLCVEVGGADKVMYGSDYPHNIGDMKGCLKRVDALPDAQMKAVRSGNARRIFKL
jgi:aminocarboxymuconate-semialdehyde decarboxylase